MRGRILVERHGRRIIWTCVALAAIVLSLTTKSRAETCRWVVSPAFGSVSVHDHIRLSAKIVGAQPNLPNSPEWSILVPPASPQLIGSTNDISFSATKPGENLIQVTGNGCDKGLAAIFVSNRYRSRIHERFVTLGISPPVRVREGGIGQGAAGASSSAALEIEAPLAAFSMLVGAQETHTRHPATGLTANDVEQDLHVGLSLNTTGRSYLTMHVVNFRQSPALPQLRGYGVGYTTLIDAYRESRRWTYDAEYYWNLTGDSNVTSDRPSYGLFKCSLGYVQHLSVEGTFLKISGFREQGYSADPSFPMFTRSGIELSIGSAL